MEARDGGGLREVTKLWAELPSQKQALNDMYLKGLSLWWPDQAYSLFLKQPDLCYGEIKRKNLHDFYTEVIF